MDIYTYLQAVREKGPLVHHVTNWVTIYDCAQVVKSFGGSPVMAHAPEEVADMTGIASALVLNIGTLTRELVASMKLAARAAAQRGLPVVLDVCGAGATRFRDEACLELLDAAPITFIKGNASEVARIAGLRVRTRGVDAGEIREDLEDLARQLATQRGCTVVITGKRDIVADRRRAWAIGNGVAGMAQVVGTGCMAASVIGAFAGASPEDPLQAAVAGLCCYEIAAQLAWEQSPGPGSFKPRLFDAIHSLTPEQVHACQKVEPCADTTSSPTGR